MSCPNFLICGQEGHVHNGNIYTCNCCGNSRYGYMTKKIALMHSLRPDVYEHPTSGYEYHSRKLYGDTRDKLYKELKELN